MHIHPKSSVVGLIFCVICWHFSFDSGIPSVWVNSSCLVPSKGYLGMSLAVGAVVWVLFHAEPEHVGGVPVFTVDIIKIKRQIYKSQKQKK